MSVKERNLFEKSLEHKPFYLEYGCGGSTEIAVALGCKAIVAVDSDINWIDSLKQKPPIAERIAKGTLFFEYVDIGPVGAWGFPKDSSKIRNWPNYVLAPYQHPYQFDFILVDGRFRNACAYAAWAFMTDDTVMAVHDYTVRRQYYDIEKFFNIVEQVDSLILLKKKEKITMRSLYTSVMTHMFMP